MLVMNTFSGIIDCSIRALLEVIATKLATSDESIDDYMKKTLLYHSMDHEELVKMVKSTMQDRRFRNSGSCDRYYLARESPKA